MPELRIYDSITDLPELKGTDDVAIRRKDVFSVRAEAANFTTLSIWIAEQSAITYAKIEQLLPFDCIDFQGAKLEEIPTLLGFIETEEMKILKPKIIQDLQEERKKAEDENREMQPVPSLIEYYEIFERVFPFVEQRVRVGKNIAQALMLKDAGALIGFYNEMRGTDDARGTIDELPQIGLQKLADILYTLVDQLMDEFYPTES